MPIKKELPHKALLRRLLASKKLSKAEQVSFTKMNENISKGQNLDQSQKLWIEALTKKYLTK
jgi:hypothetical protein